MVEVFGKEGTVARILLDSISPSGSRLTTYEIEVSRTVWAEFLTHGMLCRNAASSRAIPFKAMQDQLTGKPVRFGKANKGMTDAGEHDALINGMYTADEWWYLAKLSASKFSEGFYEAGYAKQIFNRPTETYQMIKAVVSATEFDNFFWLRNHTDADPTLEELARCMYEVREQSVPALLQPGQWHLPYVAVFFNLSKGEQVYCIESTEKECTNVCTDQKFWKEVTLEEAIKVSCARCAAVSYRAEDYSLERCLRVYDALVGDERKHASAMQHCATPMKENHTTVNVDKYGGDYINAPEDPRTWEPGISHADREGNLWSAQYKGWIMYRKLIPGENYVEQN